MPARAVLERLGWTVWDAERAGAALALARERRPDLALIDAAMRASKGSGTLLEG